MSTVKPIWRPATEVLGPHAAEYAAELEANGIEWYRREYENGWRASHRGTTSRRWDSGAASFAWEDGYLDAASGREKWHYPHCADPDACGRH